MSLLLVALGAALGAAIRFQVSSRVDAALPWGTLLVNVVGSLVLGVVAARALEGHAYALLGTGFCGGLTTYSSFAVQTSRLSRGRGAAFAAGTVLLSLGACALGFWLAA